MLSIETRTNTHLMRVCLVASCKFFERKFVNYETNLLKLINLSLAYVYCSNLLSNYGLIRLKRFVSQFTDNL